MKREAFGINAQTDAESVAESLRQGYWLRICAGHRTPTTKDFLDYCETGIRQYYFSLQSDGRVPLREFRARVGAIVLQRLLLDAEQKNALALRLKKALRAAAPRLEKRTL